MSVRPIETTYRGYLFRSRLEARWAVFFDALGIEWEYEPEGFVLPDGERYLPDFFLPTFDGGMYVEVKPTDEEFAKARKFAEAAKTRVWLAHGVPRPFAWTVYCANERDPYEFCGIPNGDQADGENRMFSEPGYEEEDGSIGKDMYCALGATFVAAVKASRSARFEFSEEEDFGL